MPVTLRDIARETGYSVTTISRALNDYDDVSSDTKQTIRDAAEQLGYHPNVVAQNLRRQRTNTLGIILPTAGHHFPDPFFLEFLTGIGYEASRQGYDLLVSTQPPGPEELDVYRRFVHGKRVDGLIVARTRRQDSRIAYLLEQGFPFVAFGRTEDGGDFPFVDEDGRAGMAEVTQHLINAGHRRIAFITADQHLTFSRHRMLGYRGAMARHDIPIDAALIVEGNLSQRSGRLAARHLLNLSEPPSAIMAMNDLMALGAMAAVQARGLRVGVDVAVTGFDDIPLAESSHPPLTTVRQPIHRIGEMVCQMLIRVTRDEPLDHRQVILRPKLMVRMSSIQAASGYVYSESFHRQRR